MSITVNVTEGNKVTVHRQDPISVSLNTTVNNEVTIQKTPPVSITVNKQEGSNINITQQANVSVGIQRQDPISISIHEPGKSSSVTTWGSIGGTITNQTDLVNYITSRLPSDTINDAEDVLQVLEDAGLTLAEDAINAKVPFTIFGKDENGNPIVIPETTTPLGYTLPKPNTGLLSNVPYFMVTKSDGTNINLSWLNLGFALGDDDQYILDGGEYGS